MHRVYSIFYFFWWKQWLCGIALKSIRSNKIRQLVSWDFTEGGAENQFVYKYYVMMKIVILLDSEDFAT